MYQLEQLYGELDVPQPARPALDLAVPLGLGYRLDDPLPHRPDVHDRFGSLGRVPDEWLQRFQPPVSQIEVPGGRTGLQQRLELPGARPLPAVRQVAGQAADQRSPAALGAQRGIDWPGDLTADLHEPHRDPGRRPQVLVVGTDEDDVHIGHIVQLAAAAFAHRDDRQTGAL